MKHHLLEYHKEKELTLHGEGMYKKLEGLSNGNGNKLDIFHFIFSYDNQEKLKLHFDYFHKSLDIIIKEEKLNRNPITYYLKKNYKEDFEEFKEFQFNNDSNEVLDKLIEETEECTKSKYVKEFIKSFYPKVVLIKKEAVKKNREIDNVSLVFFTKYYDEKAEHIKWDLPYNEAINHILPKGNITIFKLTDRIVGTVQQMILRATLDIKESGQEYIKGVKIILEDIILNDFNKYMKKGYILGNSIDEATNEKKFLPTDLFINNLLKYFSRADKSVSNTHAFFKSFKEMTEEEREKKEKEEKRTNQEKKLEDSKSKNKKQSEGNSNTDNSNIGKPSLISIGKDKGAWNRIRDRYKA